MKSREKGVLKKSELYFSTPSQTAKKLYYYPVSAGHFFGVKGYHLIRENYDSLLITHILSGSFTFVLDGKHITAHEGDTVLLDCFLPHEYYTDDAFESIWVHFSGSNCREMYDEISANYGNLIKCNDTQHIKKLLFRIFNGIGGKEAFSEMHCSLDIYKLFAELSSPALVTGRSRINYEEQIQEVKKYISEHLHDELTVQRLAEQMHMSTSHFSRVFKQQTGFTPYDYVLIARLNRAKVYLQKTNLTVSEIAYEVGFNSESNFIYFFTSHSGLSPNKFRKLKF